MGTFRTILVGTDGSASGGRAVDHAVALAAALGAGLHVVTAFEPHPGRVDQDTRAVLSALEEIERRARDAGVERIGTHAFEGDPVDALLDAAVHTRADLIVVGDRGMERQRRLGSASVPDAVTHRARCSVLVVSTTGAGAERPRTAASAGSPAGRRADPHG